jgi:hypothetical protein
MHSNATTETRLSGRQLPNATQMELDVSSAMNFIAEAKRMTAAALMAVQ